MVAGMAVSSSAPTGLTDVPDGSSNMRLISIT